LAAVSRTSYDPAPCVNLCDDPRTLPVWAREHKGIIFYNITIVRNCKDEKGYWKQSSSFTPADLPVVSALAKIAYHYVLDLEDAGLETEDGYEAAA
jgi:hypothetical protein